MFVHKAPACEAVQGECAVEWVGSILRYCVSHYPTGPRRRFETTCSPTTVDIKAFHWCEGDYGTGIGRNIHDPCPLSVHPNSRENGEEFYNRLKRTFDNLITAALTVSQILVDAGPDHQVALVRLTDIRMDCVAHDDRR